MTNAEIVENARRILYGHYPYEAFSGIEIGQISAALGVARIVLRTQQDAGNTGALKTTYETPESCPYCMEHLSKDWSFCPECGQPTFWSKNEPLTMDELREMAGDPVYLAVDDKWYIVNNKYLTPNRECIPCGIDMWGQGTSLSLLAECGVCRRKPEKGTKYGKEG